MRILLVGLLVAACGMDQIDKTPRLSGNFSALWNADCSASHRWAIGLVLTQTGQHISGSFTLDAPDRTLPDSHFAGQVSGAIADNENATIGFEGAPGAALKPLILHMQILDGLPIWGQMFDQFGTGLGCDVFF